jgi:hypothetical protein
VTTQSRIVNDNNYFVLSHLDLDADPLRESFKAIQPDAYCDGDFRFRALNRYWIEDRKLVPRPHEPFVQDIRYNKLWGSMKRNFPGLDFGLKATTSLTALCLQFADRCDIALDAIELGVHPIRTVCPRGGSAPPAPEGIHTDGYPFVGLFVLHKDDAMTGGETSLYTARQGGDVVFRKTLKAGDLLSFDDRRVFHHTTPIRMSNGTSGIRDVIGLSLSPRAGQPNPEGYTR